MDAEAYTALYKAIQRVEGEKAKIQLLGHDYYLLKSSQPTTKKGQADMTKKTRFNKQAEKLFNILVFGDEMGNKKPIKLTLEQEKAMLEEFAASLPKYNRHEPNK